MCTAWASDRVVSVRVCFGFGTFTGLASACRAGNPVRVQPERRKVAGRVLDSDCRSVAWQLVKVCPANEARWYIHKRDRPCAVIDPKSTGVGQCAGILTSPTSVLDLVSPPLEGRTSWQ